MSRSGIYGRSEKRTVKHDASGYFLTVIDKRQGRMFSAQVRGGFVCVEMTNTNTGQKEVISRFKDGGGLAVRMHGAAQEIERLTGRTIADGVLL